MQAISAPRSTTRSRTDESLRIFHELGDRRHSGWALQVLGRLSAREGDNRQGRAFLEQSVADFQTIADLAGMGLSLRDLAVVVSQDGDDALAENLFEQSLGLLREQGDHWNLGWTLHHAAELREKHGQRDRARGLLEEALDHFRAVRFKAGIVTASIDLARFDRLDGHYRQARSRLAEALALTRDIGSDQVAWRALVLLGVVALDDGAYAPGLRILGATAAPGSESAALQIDRADLEARLAAARSALGVQESARMWAAGQAMSLEQARAFALETEGV